MPDGPKELPMSIWSQMSQQLIVGFVLGFSGMAAADEKPSPPLLDGRLLFHRYSSYDNFDSQLFLFDFQSKSLTCLSENWPIDHAMNAHSSPNGEWIVFMGLPKSKRGSKDWDVYCWKFGSNQQPENLTEGNGLRDEDPNFASDGSAIVFKQAGQIAILNQKTKSVQQVKIPGTAERSMPVFAASGRQIVVMENAAEDGDLFVVDRDGTHRKTVAAEPKLQEYFPVRWDDNRLLYVRWAHADNRNDQVYVHNWKTGVNQPLAFCKQDANYSDPYPIDGRWLIFSSTREQGSGGYDLYLGDSKTGAIQYVGLEALNTKAEELGSSYLPRRTK
jgi:Tol biopolymer transport system component